MVWQLLCVSVLATLASAAVRLEQKCSDPGAFSCHSSDPTAFTRCLEGQLFEFYCPDGLNFNTQTQTCDWPESADCTYKLKGGVKENLSEQAAKPPSEPSGSAKESSGESRGPIVSKGQHGVTKKPWWRPENVDPSSWENSDNLFELPFDKVQGSSVKSQGGDSVEIIHSSSGSGGKSSTGGESISKAKSSGGSSGGSASRSTGGGGKTKATKVAKRPIRVSASADNTHRPDLGNVVLPKGECGEHNCKLPNCFCPGSVIPFGLSAKDTPQMVMITFDDEVSAAYYGYFQRLFRPGRYNPNGCPVRGALFVSGSGTDYDLVYPLYAMGVEIASHTLSHRFPHTWWSSASYQDYYDEVIGMKRSLTEKSGIPFETIKGFRVPFLQLGSDSMYKALYDGKFAYDTSMFTGAVWEGGPPVWPFTLDFVPGEYYCQHGPCPRGQYPGLWEIPVQRWYGLDGHSCAMADGCTSTGDADEALQFLRSNFLRYYNSNRAPFGIFVHARWFHTEHHIDALDRFIDELMQMNDVYVVTPSQVIEWMRKPTSLHEVQYFQPWSCEGSIQDKRKK